MREIITLSVGQCGNQVSKKFWEALTEEHGIDPDKGTYQGNDDIQLQRSDVYFNEIPGGRFVPRSVLIDLEPGVLNAVRADKKMGRLFNPDNYISSTDGAGNNWAKGYFTDGAEIIEETLDQVRKNVELCDSLQGYQLMHSIGGGTGSGFGSLLIEKLKEDYPDKMINNFSIMPGSISAITSDCVVEPYNSVLTLNALIEHSDSVFTIENSALNRICQKNLKIKNPSFFDINHIIAQVMSNTTATLRFPGFENNCDLRKLSTNLVPFPRLHFLLQGQAPLLGVGESKFENLGVQGIANQMFDSRSILSDSGDIHAHGKIMTAACLFRGKNVSAYEVEQTIAQYKKKQSGHFIEWIPDNMMESICKVGAAWNTNSSITGTFLANSTCQSQGFSKILELFDKMHKKNAYTHWYTNEGMDKMEFTEAASNLRDLISEYQTYQEAQCDSINGDDDEGMDLMEEEEKAMEDFNDKFQKTCLNSLKSNATTMAGSEFNGSL